MKQEIMVMCVYLNGHDVKVVYFHGTYLGTWPLYLDFVLYPGDDA